MTRLRGEGDPQGIVQETEIWPCYQMVYGQPRIRPREWDAQNSLGFCDANRSPKKTSPSYSQKKKKKKKREPAD